MDDLENNASGTWNHLPDIALSKIFKHLTEENDRYGASLVCQNWSRAFKFPELWSKMKFTTWSGTKKASKFVNSLGECLRELEIECSPEMRNPNVMSEESFDNFSEFLSSILTHGVPINLKKLIFKNLDWIYQRDNAKIRVKQLIHNFIATQRNLTHFDMENCRASPEVGIDFLSQLAENNSRSLRNLNLVDFFSRVPSITHPNEVLNSPDNFYQGVMASFKNLVELRVNYSYIDSNVLTRIVESCSSSLQLIKFYCCRGDDRIHDHVIENDTWKLVRKMRRKLQVDFDIEFYQNFLEYAHIISSREMGLNRFHARTTGHNVRGLKILLMQLLQFRETLVDLNLDFGSNNIDGDFEDSLLIELVASCRELKRLSFHGTCSNQDTPKTVLEMMAMDDSNLKNCRFTILFDKSTAKVASIKELKRKLLSRSLTLPGVKFNFDYYFLPTDDTFCPNSVTNVGIGMVVFYGREPKLKLTKMT